MTYSIQKAQRAVSAHDQSDALRIVEATVVLAAIPGIASAAARDLASARLREMMGNHPSSAEFIGTIVQYLESHS